MGVFPAKALRSAGQGGGKAASRPARDAKVLVGGKTGRCDRRTGVLVSEGWVTKKKSTAEQDAGEEGGPRTQKKKTGRGGGMRRGRKA